MKMNKIVVKEELGIPEIIVEDHVTTVSEYIGCDKILKDLQSAVANDR